MTGRQWPIPTTELISESQRSIIGSMPEGHKSVLWFAPRISYIRSYFLDLGILFVEFIYSLSSPLKYIYPLSSSGYGLDQSRYVSTVTLKGGRHLVRKGTCGRSSVRQRLEKLMPGNKELIKINLSTMEVAQDVTINGVACRIKDYSGDDLTNVCRDTSLNGMRHKITGKMRGVIKNMPKDEISKDPIAMCDFEEALTKVQRSVSSTDIQFYRYPTPRELVMIIG